MQLKMKIKYQLIKIVLIFASMNLNAQGVYQILNMPYSARDIALCNTGIADSYHSISYNPASLKANNFIVGFHILKSPMDISFTRIEAIIPKENNILFFEIKNADYGNFIDDLNSKEFSARETNLKLGIKKPFFNTISGSISVEYIYSSISKFISQAIVSTVGIRAETINGNNGFGISIENFGIMFDYYDDSIEEIIIKYRFSGYHKLKYTPSTIHFSILNDNYSKYISSISIESKYKSLINFRVGIGGIDPMEKKLLNKFDYSFGVGLYYNNYLIDFGFKNINNIGVLSGISMRYKIL